MQVAGSVDGGAPEGETPPTAPGPLARSTAERAAGSSEKLAAATRSLVSMRLQAAAAARDPSQKSGALSSAAASSAVASISSSSSVPHMEMRAPLLADLQLIARRAAHDGTAVCDDPTHIEWLADTAWHLAYLEGR